jgi:hypothetical protein
MSAKYEDYNCQSIELGKTQNKLREIKHKNKNTIE